MPSPRSQQILQITPKHTDHLKNLGSDVDLYGKQTPSPEHLSSQIPAQSWVWHYLTKIEPKSWISALAGCAEAAASRNGFVQQLCSREAAEQRCTGGAGHSSEHMELTGEPRAPGTGSLPAQGHIVHKAANLLQNI